MYAAKDLLERAIMMKIGDFAPRGAPSRSTICWFLPNAFSML
jgi:hypothetical protein